MEAKETVMPEEGRIILSHMNPEIIEATLTELLNKQAEISFKAGMKEEAKGGHNSISFLDGYKEGKQAGIKEVVEWIRGHYAGGKQYGAGYYAIEDRDLDNKLKEWGIDE